MGYLDIPIGTLLRQKANIDALYFEGNRSQAIPTYKGDLYILVDPEITYEDYLRPSCYVKLFHMSGRVAWVDISWIRNNLEVVNDES